MKFLHKDGWVWDYNAIPEGPQGKYLLEKINAKGVSVTTGGLLHLGKLFLCCSQSTKLVGCGYIRKHQV